MNAAFNTSSATDATFVDVDTTAIAHNLDDVAMGAKVISYCAQALAFAGSMAIAASCSTFIGALVVGTICTIVLTLLATLAAFFGTCAMKTAHVEAIGRGTNAVLFKVGGLFAKARNVISKPAAQVAA